MKKRVLLLLPLFLGACSDGGESPIIKIEKLSVKVDSDNNSVEGIIRKSKFPQNPKRSVRFSGKRTKRSVQKRKARNTQKAETKVL